MLKKRNMEVLEFLNNAEIIQLVQQYNITKLHKKQVSYNLFTISSYNSYLENFHSDIISSLLNPIGLHQQGYTFLHLFINYLNQNYNCNLLTSDFQDTIVTRETGRLDIWIRDEKTKLSIIIENKINNAVDMDEQIDRYFSFAENARYKVKAVVYLSLDGKKKAPPTIENLGHLVKNIGAFTNMENDLVNGWLQLCLKEYGNTDSLSVIHQYIKLIQHLSNNNMDTRTMEDFYMFLSTNDGVEIANTVVEMYSKMSTYRRDKFARSILNYDPFKKAFPWAVDFMIYDDFKVKDCFLKLSIRFNSDCTVTVTFLNRILVGSDGIHYVAEILENTKLLADFKLNANDNYYFKDFRIGEDCKSLDEVDHTAREFVENFLKKLKDS